MDWVWVVRAAMLSASGFLIGVTFMVGISYYKRWRSHVGEWRGLLPFHVWTIAASYDLLLASATVEVVIRIGEDAGPSWRLLVLPTAYVLGITAMVIMGRLGERDKLRGVQAKSDVVS